MVIGRDFRSKEGDVFLCETAHVNPLISIPENSVPSPKTGHVPFPTQDHLGLGMGRRNPETTQLQERGLHIGMIRSGSRLGGMKDTLTSSPIPAHTPCIKGLHLDTWQFASIVRGHLLFPRLSMAENRRGACKSLPARSGGGQDS